MLIYFKSLINIYICKIKCLHIKPVTTYNCSWTVCQVYHGLYSNLTVAGLYVGYTVVCSNLTFMSFAESKRAVMSF